ncbi:hypothetical protein MRB53_013177 [Persea americana]|uniref:Uncharacterized protein n=1 Tax=Persea americana TaxID=3435 RepID=A0ACC2K7B9_PERAE|nr:hypothetical protein MRB53_013177 [Persea americana]
MEEAVFEVCAKGDALKFQRLLQEDQSVITQSIGRARHTPLHLACKFKHNELASLILGLQPALAKAKNDKEETPLHEASRVGELEIVKQLLDACPCVAYMLNRDKESALYIACSCWHSEVAWELCSRMDFQAWDEIGAACLQIAASNGYTEIVRKILEEYPSLASRKSEKGLSALHLASSKGNLGVINEILGKDPNLSFLRDNDGRTPLHLAMIYNQVHVVKEFLLGRPRPASFNCLLVTDLITTADNNGDTVLHLAAKRNCLEIIELLLSKPGIKVNAANNEGNTALDILEQIPVGGNDANVAVDIFNNDEFVAGDVLKQIPERDNDEYVAIDVSEQIPARDTDANVANDSYCRRKAIIQQLKPRERANPSSLIDMQLKLMVVTGLILTITFQAILSPPGGLWQDLSRGNHTNHIPGKAIQSETNAGLFTFFMAADALGFLVSLALLPIIMILRKEMLLYVNSLVVLALISIEVAFILSLIMISGRKPFFRVEVFLLVLATLAGIGWMQWKWKPQLKRS